MAHRESDQHFDRPEIFREIDPKEFGKRYDMRKILCGLRRHLFLIFSIAIFCGVLGTGYTWYNLTRYRARAVLLFQEELIEKRESRIGFNITELTLPTAIDLILTPSHLDTIISTLGLDLAPRDLERMIHIQKPRDKSKVVRIEAVADNEHVAMDIANTLARLSVKSSEELIQNQLKKVLESYQRELESTKETLTRANQLIEKFKIEHQYLEMGTDFNRILSELIKAKEQLEVANMNYSELLDQYENFKSEVANIPEYVTVPLESATPPVTTRLLTLKAQLAEAKTRYTEKNPKVKRLQEEIDLLVGEEEEGETAIKKTSIQRNALRESADLDLKRMESILRSAQKKKEQLEERFEQIQVELKDVPTEQMELAKLLYTKDVTEEQLKRLIENSNRMQLMLSRPQGNLELYLPAEKAQPRNDQTIVYLIPFIGLAIGVFGGLFIAFILEMNDSMIRTKKQVEINYLIPHLATIPKLSRLQFCSAERKTLYFIRQLADRFLLLEEKIRREVREDNNIGFAASIVSGRHCEGKSTVAFHLAKYLKRLDKKTVLVELDYYPNKYTHSVNAKYTLEMYLIGKASIDQLINRGPIDIVKLGKKYQDISELVKSEKYSELIEILKDRYDYVIVDAPGIIDDEYGCTVAGNTDCCIVVVNSSGVRKKVLDQTLEELQGLGVEPRGIVLNNVNPVYIYNDKLRSEMKKAKRL
ncbi:MAG: hypothetical protein VX777_04100 [Chlamydiota bacterium]|nr:hypothetical protein [Chlamydiota bacterium]